MLVTIAKGGNISTQLFCVASFVAKLVCQYMVSLGWKAIYMYFSIEIKICWMLPSIWLNFLTSLMMIAYEFNPVNYFSKKEKQCKYHLYYLCNYSLFTLYFILYFLSYKLHSMYINNCIHTYIRFYRISRQWLSNMYCNVNLKKSVFLNNITI